MFPIFANFLEQEEDAQRRYELKLERRILRERLDPLNLPNKEFIKLFRLNKEMYQHLLHELTPLLQDGQRNSKLSVETCKATRKCQQIKKKQSVIFTIIFNAFNKF